MCGILGLIGKSVNPKVSFEIAHALFVKTEQRGEHASGFWACESGADGAIYYDKEPTKSSNYVTRPIWSRDFAKIDADLLLAHCRFSSFTNNGAGHEKINRNNHPHVSADFSTALVHNGKVPEYPALKGRYNLGSDCDSEILLRMYESTEDSRGKEEMLRKEFPKLPPQFSYRLLGLKEIFARVNAGMMAVGVGERGPNGTRCLWVFRDKERPLHVVDMRKTLGQIIFFSTAEIWRSAVDACPAIKPYISDNLKIIELPEDQIWMLSFDDQGKWLVKKFKITKTRLYNYDKDEDDAVEIKRDTSLKPCTRIFGRLNANEEVIEPKVSGTLSDLKKKVTIQTTTTATPSASGADSVDDDAEELEIKGIDMEQFGDFVKNIKETVADIETGVENLVKESSISDKDFDVVMSGLKDALAELQATLIVVKPA